MRNNSNSFGGKGFKDLDNEDIEELLIDDEINKEELLRLMINMDYTESNSNQGFRSRLSTSKNDDEIL